MKLNKITAILVTSGMIYGGTAAHASIPASVTPVFGNVVVDGDYSEWNLATDTAVEMREAGKADKDLLSMLYLRYDCNTQTMYAFVLAEDGYEALESANDAWIKFDSLPGNGKVVDGNSGSSGTPPDFAWVYDGATLIGYEASFTLAPGTYTEDVEVHIQIKPGRTSSTGKGGNGGTMEYLTLEVLACPNLDIDDDDEPNDTDNCLAVANPDQINTDFDMVGGDNMGDACDGDDDADGIFDIGDNCPLTPNPNQSDGNDDGTGDACTALAVDLLEFTVKATGNGTTVEWRTGDERHISAFELYKGIPKVGNDCSSNNPDDYGSFTKIKTENSDQKTYTVYDNFPVIANKTYCYGLVSINDNGDIVDKLGAKPRQ